MPTKISCVDIIRAHRDAICPECSGLENCGGKPMLSSVEIIRAHRDGICIECGHDILDVAEQAAKPEEARSVTKHIKDFVPGSLDS